MYPSLCICCIITGSGTSRRKCSEINGRTAQDRGVKGELCGWEVFVPLHV